MSTGRNGMLRIWMLNALLAAATATTLLGVAHTRAYDASFTVAWPVLAILFFATEVFVVHVQFRSEAESFSLSEIPIVLGLFFASPVHLVVGQLVGVSAGLFLVRKQPPAKAIFNMAQMTTGTLVAWRLFHWFAAPGGILSAKELSAGFVATVVAIALGVLLVVVAVSLAEGRPAMHMLPRVLPLAGIVAITNTSVGLVAVAALRTQPIVAVLLLVPAGTLFFAYRAYTHERRRHESMESLYESTRMLQRSLEMDRTISDLLDHARNMFRSEIVQLTLFRENGRATRMRLDTAGLAQTEVPDANEIHKTWAAVVRGGTSMLVTKPVRNPMLRKTLNAEGIRDAIVAPLLADNRVIGMVQVCNRLGDVSTFDEDEMRMLETVANHASIALENARLVAELQEALARATELNRMKDDFVATVSHELRTPLTSIQGFVKTMRRDDFQPTPGEQESYLEVVDRQSERLRKHIDDLLLLSRLESRTIRIDAAPVSLPTLVTQLVDDSWAASQHRFVVDMPEGLTPFVTDGEKLTQIVSNLIDNALKYSPPDGPITIGGAAGGGWICVTVEDAGCGIDAEQAAHIWDRFYRVDQSLTRRTGGLGLGLYICKSLAEELGGRVELAWSEPGQGSRFAVWLPLPEAARPKEPVVLDLNKVASQV